jgi:hypothetical protein
VDGKNPAFSKPTAPSKIRHPPKKPAFSKLIGASPPKIGSLPKLKSRKILPVVVARHCLNSNRQNSGSKARTHRELSTPTSSIKWRENN